MDAHPGSTASTENRFLGEKTEGIRAEMAPVQQRNQKNVHVWMAR